MAEDDPQPKLELVARAPCVTAQFRPLTSQLSMALKEPEQGVLATPILIGMTLHPGAMPTTPTPLFMIAATQPATIVP